MKIQGIDLVKPIYNRLTKLYRMTAELEEFILMEKLFNISYISLKSSSIAGGCKILSLHSDL